LIFPIAASGEVGSQELDQSESPNWDKQKELQLLRVIGGFGSGLFLEPTDIAIGESGNIYVADYGNNRIQILNSLGQLVQTIELKGSPHGITLDKDENIYVTEWWDFIGVEKFTKTGEPAADFKIEDQSVFGLPADIVIDSAGTLYVLEHRNLDIDYGENAGVHKIDTDGSYLEFIPILGMDDTSKFTLMMIDDEDYLYIVDQSGNDIIILDPLDGDSRALALASFTAPTSIALNPDGYLFVADNRTLLGSKPIHVFDEFQQLITSIGEWGTQDGEISNTHGLEFDKNGNMYVVDFDQNKIQVFHIAPKVFESSIYEETKGSIPTTPQYSPSGDDLVAVLNTGSGQMVIEFFDDDAPGHVQNFIALAENDWYETTLFHRIIKNFMIQGGDPGTKPEPGNTSDKWGTGDAGYKINAEFNSIKHERGIVSMARSVDIDSAGSQFFIIHKDSPHLDENYTVFGRLITSESYETLDKMANLKTNSRDQPYENDIANAILFDVDIVPRSSIENVLTLDPPNRTIGFIPDTSNTEITSEEASFTATAPANWTEIEPIKFNDNSPVYLLIGPNKDGITPHIYINTRLLGEEDTFNDFIKFRKLSFHKLNSEGHIELESEQILPFKGGHVYVVSLKQSIDDDIAGNDPYKAQVKQFLFATSTIIYGITYVNVESNFTDHLDLLTEFVESFQIEDPKYEILSDVSTEDPNWDGKYYNNEEYQFRLEMPYRYEPLIPKISIDSDGINHYILALEPDSYHVNYYKDGVQARYMLNIYDTADKPFTEYSTQIKNTYSGMAAKGEISFADEYMGMTADGHPIYFVEYLEPYFITVDDYIPIHTRELVFANADFLYRISYTNHENNFIREITSFNYLLENIRFSFDGEMRSIDWGPNIIKYNPIGEPAGGGCLIATAAFGSEMAPQIQFLREIRDNTVLQTESGTSFMAGFNQFYYSFSPAIADYERENPVFKEAVKLTLTPLLTSLTLLQYTDIDSESEMLGYGISIILLNIGMYFVAPAVVIMKIRSFYKLQ